MNFCANRCLSIIIASIELSRRAKYGFAKRVGGCDCASDRTHRAPHSVSASNVKRVMRNVDSVIYCASSVCCVHARRPALIYDQFERYKTVQLYKLYDFGVRGDTYDDN